MSRGSRFLPSLCILIGLLGLAPAQAQDGEALAKKWCSSCHQFPQPQLLDKTTWARFVLPDMGARLGMPGFGGQPYRANPNAPGGVYATEPLMEPDEWARIVAWYEHEAPDQLMLPAWHPRGRLDLFGIEVPEREKGDFPTSTAVFIDEASHRLLVGDSFELDLEIYRADLGLVGEVRTGGAVSRIARLPSGSYLATTMGGNIGQSEDLHGLLIEIGDDASSKAPSKVRRLIKRLHRPVDVVYGDFDKDGATDYVAAEFGTHFGKLSLHLSEPGGTLDERVLLTDAGATTVSVVGDELVVLMAQGDERIVRLKDFASGGPVSVQTILQFPPSLGSTSMRIVDFNGDGSADLLTTAGDNADFSPILKPYHGIYLFAGQPDGTFRQEMFFSHGRHLWRGGGRFRSGRRSGHCCYFLFPQH